MKTCPGDLRTGIQSMAPRQEGERINIAAEIGPLSGAEPAIDCDEETHGRVEELKAAFELLEPSGGVLPGRAECAIELLTVAEAAAEIGLR